MSTYEGNEAAEITPQEENQLRRVHRLLCDYGAKKKVLKLLRPKQDQLEKLRQSADDEQADILVASEIQSLETDVEKLRQDLQEIEKKSDGLVSCDLGVPRCCGAFTPSTRLASIRRGRG